MLYTRVARHLNYKILNRDVHIPVSRIKYRMHFYRFTVRDVVSVRTFSVHCSSISTKLFFVNDGIYLSDAEQTVTTDVMSRCNTWTTHRRSTYNTSYSYFCESRWVGIVNFFISINIIARRQNEMIDQKLTLLRRIRVVSIKINDTKKRRTRIENCSLI